ncbi:MAG: tRNA 2-selenouridine(34) synthase MnmH, partial [Pseudomonadales bacterium]|nr:tRNA 2-selenouridine(34) synthase MnmH [Pseudomonadales bacterium]
MSDLIQAGEFATLFQNQTPLLDVRAPVEFKRGAFPNTINHPLLNDDERQAVGRRYREQGREAAIALGQELVAGEVKAARVRAWKDYVQNHPNCALYCFRGGLRSSIAQQWLAAEGIHVPRIAGGYKALRRSLIEHVQRLASDDNLVVIAGKTGSGKTHLLNSLPNSLDLEGFAQHRGSAFGRRAQGQPSQIDFENRLAIRLLDLNWQDTQRVAVEDESRAIGSLSVPLVLHQRMCEAPIA